MCLCVSSSTLNPQIHSMDNNFDETVQGCIAQSKEKITFIIDLKKHYKQYYKPDIQGYITYPFEFE